MLKGLVQGDPCGALGIKLESILLAVLRISCSESRLVSPKSLFLFCHVHPEHKEKGSGRGW